MYSATQLLATKKNMHSNVAMVEKGLPPTAQPELRDGLNQLEPRRFNSYKSTTGYESTSRKQQSSSSLRMSLEISDQCQYLTMLGPWWRSGD